MRKCSSSRALRPLGLKGAAEGF